jgi:signal transduction histidine kinase
VDETTRLGSLLSARRSGILERWTQRIRRDHAPAELSRGELWDDLPHIFDELLATLRGDERPANDATPAEGSHASNHGTQRLRMGFDVEEVVREHGILADCILTEVEEIGGTVSPSLLRRILNLLNTSSAQAVCAYVHRRDEELARQTTRHVAFIAHEVRGPLATAFMALEAIGESTDPKTDRALALMKRNLIAVRQLIDDVLTADRLAGQVQLTRESLDLRQLLEQSVAEARPAAERRKIAIVTFAPESIPFNGDPRLLRSAISNILGNAVKFTHESESITVRATRHEGRITLEFEDRCGGLPDGNPAQLFEPSVQRSDDRTGFGLGLAIVKQALEAHGGRVDVRNLPGKGCIFSLELPESESG